MLGFLRRFLFLQMLASAKKFNKEVFRDGFEREMGWSMFEEIVNECYTDLVGSIELSDMASFAGNRSLAVWSNKGESSFSNHVIAGKTILDHGVGGIWKYLARAFIPTDSFSTTQVGPEISFQNTRIFENGTSYTSIAGIQYVASSYIPEKWNIWVEKSDNVAEWIALPILSSLPTLTADVWYNFNLFIDFDKNEYIKFALKNKSTGDVHEVSLEGISIAKELRGFAAASVITVESENLFNNCGTAGVFSSIIYYDKAVVWTQEGDEEV